MFQAQFNALGFFFSLIAYFYQQRVRLEKRYIGIQVKLTFANDDCYLY